MATNLADRGGRANPADNRDRGRVWRSQPADLLARRRSMPGGWGEVAHSVERASGRYR